MMRAALSRATKVVWEALLTPYMRTAGLTLLLLLAYILVSRAGWL